MYTPVAFMASLIDERYMLPGGCCPVIYRAMVGLGTAGVGLALSLGVDADLGVPVACR